MKHILSNIPLRYKYLLSLVTVVFLSYSVFAIINTFYLTSDIRQQAENTLSKTLNQASSFLEYNTSMIKYGADVFVYQHSDEAYFYNDKSVYQNMPGLYIVHANLLNRQLFNIYEIPNVDSCVFCLNGGFGSIYPHDSILELSDYQAKNWFSQISQISCFYTWALGGIEEDPINNSYITLIRKIYDSQNLQVMTGILAVNIHTQVLDSILSQAQINHAYSIYLVNSKNELLSFCSDSPFSAQERSTLIRNLPKAEESGFIYTEINGNKYLAGYSDIDLSDWRLVITVPESHIFVQTAQIYNSIFLSLLLTFPLLIMISCFLSGLIVKPVQALICNMKQAEQGNFNIPISPFSKDEIGQLNRSFNVMLTKLIFLMDERYRLGKEKKNEQLKALQAQINPHFLYNTLDMINLMAINGDTAQIQTAIQSLSRFYRLSLNSGSDVTTLKEELEHIREYVKIQNFRFDNKIHLQIHVPDALLECRIFKICLQPLVENAIYHGIQEKDSEEGIICISARQEDEYLFLSIIDDGVGMDENTLNHILLSPKRSPSGGYGIYNVQERIHINYGNDCGISYISHPGEGTTAILKIRINYHNT